MLFSRFSSLLVSHWSRTLSDRLQRLKCNRVRLLRFVIGQWTCDGYRTLCVRVREPSRVHRQRHRRRMIPLISTVDRVLQHYVGTPACQEHDQMSEQNESDLILLWVSKIILQMYLSVRFLLLPQDFFFYCVIREPSRVHRQRHRRAFFCQWLKCANPIPCDEFQTVSCSTCLFDLHRTPECQVWSSSAMGIFPSAIVLRLM